MAVSKIKPVETGTIVNAVEQWLDDNIDQASTAAIDSTLSVAHAAAESKTVGDRLTSVDGDISDLKNAFKSIDIPWGSEGENAYILANGTTQSNNNFHYTSLITAEQNKPYTFTYLHTIEYACRIHGYDSSGTWVKQLGYYVSSANVDYAEIKFTIDDPSIVYFRISIRKYGSYNLCLYAGNLVTPVFANIAQSHISGNVPMSTANAVARCVQSYIEHNSNFIYGQDGTATKYNENGFVDETTGKYRIDCSTLALLVLMGIDYNHSLYNTNNTDNIFCAMGYGYNPFDGSSYPWNSHDLYGTYTWQMCYEYYKRGFTSHAKNRNFSNVQPGDLIFWGSTTSNETVGRFERIHHVDVVIARYGTNDALVADAGAVPITLKRASSRSANDDIAIVAHLPLGVAPAQDVSNIHRHYETPVTLVAMTLDNPMPIYTPVAIKATVTQTDDEASFTPYGIYLAGKTFDDKTKGLTFDIISNGYISANDTKQIQFKMTGGTISDLSISLSASVIDDTNNNNDEHRITFEWDANGDGKYIGADGTIGTTASFHYSELIPCLQGNGRVSILYSGTAVGTRIHGYDASGTWIKQIYGITGMEHNAEINFIVDDTDIVYLRISTPKTATIILLQNDALGLDWSHWYGKKWYAYGTSLTSATMGKYANYLAEMSGMHLTNKGIEGGGITNNGGTSTGQVKTAIMNITDGKTEADLITWEIGANEGSLADSENDLFDTSDNTFCGLFNQCIRYLMENTSAQIVVMYSPSGKTDPSTVKWYHNRKEFVRKLCQINGVYFIGEPNMFGYGRMKNGGYNVDSIHQNNIGGYNLAQFMWSKLKDIPCWYKSIPNEV